MATKNEAVIEYWLDHYIDKSWGLCGLCANHGIIDTRGIKSPAGTVTGLRTYCICPNGQIMRHYKVDISGEDKNAQQG